MIIIYFFALQSWLIEIILNDYSYAYYIIYRALVHEIETRQCRQNTEQAFWYLEDRILSLDSRGVRRLITSKFSFLTTSLKLKRAF